MKKRKKLRSNLFSHKNLQRIEVNNFKWMNGFWVSYPAKAHVRITLEFNVADRENGKLKTLWVYRTFKRSYFKSTKQIVERIRALAKYFVCHEVDECIYFDKKRIYDPHQ